MTITSRICGILFNWVIEMRSKKAASIRLANSLPVAMRCLKQPFDYQ